MYFQRSRICFLQLLIALNTNALKFIPAERHVIKANGTTRTISKYYISPEDHFKNKIALDDNKDLAKFIEAVRDENMNDEPDRKVDRYKIYIKRKFKHSKPLVETTSIPMSKKSRSESSKQRHLTKLTHFGPYRTVHHHYNKLTRVNNTQQKASAKTAVIDSNESHQKGESVDASKDSISEEVAAGEVESNKVHSVNKAAEIRRLETVAEYGDFTKPLNYESKEVFETPGTVYKSEKVEKAQINHFNEKVQSNRNMHSVYQATKSKEKQSSSEQEGTELHKLHVTQEINPQNIQSHNLRQSQKVSQSVETSSEDRSGQNVDQTSLLIDHSKDQDRPLMRDLVFKNGRSFDTYSNDNQKHKLNPLNYYYHRLHGYDNIINDQIPHARSSETLSSSISVDHSGFSGNVPHVNYDEISASPRFNQQYTQQLTEKIRRPQNFYNVSRNENVPNNPYYDIDGNGISIETSNENVNSPGSNQINKLGQLCPECFKRLYPEFLQQEQKKHLGTSSESNEASSLQLLKDSALFYDLKSPKRYQHYNPIIQLLQHNPVKVESDFESQEQPSKLLPTDTSGDIYAKETFHISSRKGNQNQSHKPLSHTNKEQVHTLSDHNNEGQTLVADSGYIDYEKIYSPFEHMDKKQPHKYLYSNHVQIHSSPDHISEEHIPELILIPNDHTNKKETNISTDTDDNLATTLYIKLKHYESDLEPIPNINLFTAANLQKYLVELEKNPKLNEDIHELKFYKIIKLLITIFKAQVDETDPLSETLWFTRLSPIVKYRIQKFVYKLLKETWFQEILIELHKNNYNFNILKESKWATQLTDWQIPANVFDHDSDDDNVEVLDDDNGVDNDNEKSIEFHSNTDQEHDASNRRNDEDSLPILKPQIRSGEFDESSGPVNGHQILTESLDSVAKLLLEKGFSKYEIARIAPKLYSAMTGQDSAPTRTSCMNRT